MWRAGKKSRGRLLCVCVRVLVVPMSELKVLVAQYLCVWVWVDRWVRVGVGGGSVWVGEWVS